MKFKTQILILTYFYAIFWYFRHAKMGSETASFDVLRLKELWVTRMTMLWFVINRLLNTNKMVYHLCEQILSQSTQKP